MAIYLVRHGQTDWNKEGKIQGSTDIPLNETGRAQAEEIRKKLKPQRFDVIFSSPLSRAYETAEIINKDYGLPLVVREELSERDYGEFEGVHPAPEFADEAWDYNKNIPIPGGESAHDVFDRVHPFIDWLTENYADKEVLVVAHGAVSRAFRFYFEPMPADGKIAKYFMQNGEILKFDLK